MATKKKAVSKKTTAKKDKSTDKKSKQLQKDIDLFLIMKKDISMKEKIIKEAKSKASELGDLLMIKMDEMQMLKLASELGAISLNSQNIGTVHDQKAFDKFVAKKGNEDMVTVKIAQAAYRLRIENGEKIAGVKNMVRKSLGYTKLKDSQVK